jgi:DNA processing protein
MDEIRKQGAAISEFPLRTGPDAWNFPRRNRVVSGLSLGVVVVEAGVKSGAMITAAQALEQGREVFAVPGNVGSATSRGVHRLIKDGAKLVEGVEDIVDELGPSVSGRRVPGTEAPAAKPALGEREQSVYDLLGDEPISIDAVTRKSGLSAPETAGTLTLLVMKRLAAELPGKMFARR